MSKKMIDTVSYEFGDADENAIQAIIANIPNPSYITHSSVPEITYFKTFDNVVVVQIIFLEVTVTSSVLEVLANLPTGYRPQNYVRKNIVVKDKNSDTYYNCLLTASPYVVGSSRIALGTYSSELVGKTIIVTDQLIYLAAES